jgi:hypothetical protein
MHKNTVVEWTNYVCEICANSLLNHPLLIGGLNMLVVIDEVTCCENKIGQVFQHCVFKGTCQTMEGLLTAVPDHTGQTCFNFTEIYMPRKYNNI